MSRESVAIIVAGLSLLLNGVFIGFGLFSWWVLTQSPPVVLP